MKFQCKTFIFFFYKIGLLKNPDYLLLVRLSIRYETRYLYLINVKAHDGIEILSWVTALLIDGKVGVDEIKYTFYTIS